MSSYYDWSAVAHEPAVVDFYGSPESRVPAPPQSPGIRKRADALAEARAELASLREAEAVASSAHKKAQDLATLKAELSYLQSLSSKPKSYLIPPDDEERPLTPHNIPPLPDAELRKRERVRGAFPPGLVHVAVLLAELPPELLQRHVAEGLGVLRRGEFLIVRGSELT